MQLCNSKFQVPFLKSINVPLLILPRTPRGTLITGWETLVYSTQDGVEFLRQEKKRVARSAFLMKLEKAVGTMFRKRIKKDVQRLP
jgi:hypothetical protein